MTQEKAIANGVIHNTIANGTTIVGTITAEHDLRVDGFIDGVIDCRGKVVVGNQGAVKGSINCANAEIVGRLEGKIKTEEVLLLKSTAVVEGEIKVATLVVEPNAKFNGTCAMLTPESAKAEQ